MNPIQLSLIPHHTQTNVPYQHLRIHLSSPNGVISPEDLKGLKLPTLQPTIGVVIEGKSPIWLYGYLVHECHATAWVGCYDPRLGGAVVVETHAPEIEVGQVLKLNLPD